MNLRQLLCNIKMLFAPKLVREVRRLTTIYSDALYAGNHQAALEPLLKVTAMIPEHATILYDLACVYAKLGMRKEALVVLKDAAEKGFTSVHQMRTKNDLDSIRELEEFQNIFKIIEKNEVADQKSFADPYNITEPLPYPNFNSLNSIIRYFKKKRAPIVKYGFWQGSWPIHKADWKFIRTKIDALQAYVESHKNASDIPDAYMEIIDTYIKLHSPIGFSGLAQRGTVERIETVVEQFRKEYPDVPLLCRAQYELICADWQAMLVEEMDFEKGHVTIEPSIQNRFCDTFFSLAEKCNDDKIRGYALIQGLDKAYHLKKEDPEKYDKLFQQLRLIIKRNRTVSRKAWSDLGISILKESGTPEFSGKCSDGIVRSLQDYKGKLLVLDFWATWCGPCRQALAECIRVYEKYKDYDVEFLGIPLELGKDMPLQAFIEWCKDEGVSWPQMYSKRGWKHPVAKKFNITQVPSIILIDSDGGLIGGCHSKFLEKSIRKELNMEELEE